MSKNRPKIYDCEAVTRCHQLPPIISGWRAYSVLYTCALRIVDDNLFFVTILFHGVNTDGVKSTQWSVLYSGVQSAG
jgi:hypothetical protein